MRAAILFSCVALAGAACVAIGGPGSTVPRESEPGEVAFELAGPGGAAMVVPVSIDGQGPFNFILDTGATLTCLDKTLADELKLEEVRGVNAVGGTVSGMGAVKLVSVDSIEVGDSRATGLRACVLDLGAIGKAGLDARGLLGLNFLKAYRLTIDFEGRVVRFDKPGSPAPTTTQ